MSTWKDYYRILQVEPEANATELKKAYRKLAVIWHPDRNPNSSVAEERFKAIAEAYAVLSDPVKKLRYDQLGPDNFAAEYGTADIFQGFDLSDLFREFGLPPIKETLFNVLADDESKKGGSVPYQDFFSAFGQKAEKGKRPGKSAPLAMTVAISLKEAVFGAIRPAAFNSGSEVIKVSLTIPPGARHGQLLTIKNRVPGTGRQMGDLLVTLNLTPDNLFTRMGRNLLTKHHLTKSELAAGCQALIPLLDEGHLRLTIPAGTKSGAIFKAAGHGAPSPDGQRGDLLITVLEGTKPS